MSFGGPFPIPSLSEQKGPPVASERTREVLPSRTEITVGKIALGVLLGTLGAYALATVIYHYSVQVPRGRAAHVAAAHALWDSELSANTGLLQGDLTMQQQDAEQSLKDSDPGSPCNSLTGMMFASCASEPDRSGQVRWIEAASKQKH